jgi:starch phosphorylase
MPALAETVKVRLREGRGRLGRVHRASIAYYSMEVALAAEIPTYSGGLGILAGDVLRSASDLGLPMVGVTLLYHHGFFTQALDAKGRQVERPVIWNPDEHLERLEPTVEVTIGGRVVTVGVWRRILTGVGGAEVPVYLLDTDLAGNDAPARAITDRLYLGTPAVRLAQETVLGLAGPAMLEALGHDGIAVHHMNEGHAALVPVALLGRQHGGAIDDITPDEVADVRARCVFTTHTPVPAGHDRFAPEVATEVLGDATVEGLLRLGCLEDGSMNMTLLGMTLSGFVNGVAQRHGEVSQAMFPRFHVEAITNGVHVPTWAAPSTAALLDHHLPGWRSENGLLRYATTIPLPAVSAAHARAKGALFDAVVARGHDALDPEVFTIGVARRVTPYKRNDLLLSRPEILRALTRDVGPIQILFAGKSHPLDAEGKELIERITAAARALSGDVRVIYLDEYGMGIARLLVAGVDLWLNTPVAPHEASGTSGMKAALNGVPSLSVLDGWWVEGHVEGVTGWGIGPDHGPAADVPIGDPVIDHDDAEELYRVLREIIVPTFYRNPDAYATVRRSAIALNGSFFTTERMVTEYARRAYGMTPHYST